MFQRAVYYAHLVVFGVGIFGTVYPKIPTDIDRPEVLPDNAAPAKKGPIFPELRKNPDLGPVVSQVDALPDGYLYVVRSGDKLLVNDSPPGVVLIREFVNKGNTVVIPGKFVDGDGKFEVREYNDAFVYLVAPVAKGKVELLVNQTLDRTSTIRKTLDVSGSGGGDVVPPPMDALAKALQEAYNGESEDEKKLLPTVIQLYKSASKILETTDTWVGFFVAMQKRSEELKVDGKLIGVKSVVQGELKKIFPSGELDPNLKIPDKKVVQDTFDRVVAAMQKVK